MHCFFKHILLDDDGNINVVGDDPNIPPYPWMTKLDKSYQIQDFNARKVQPNRTLTICELGLLECGYFIFNHNIEITNLIEKMSEELQECTTAFTDGIANSVFDSIGKTQQYRKQEKWTNFKKSIESNARNISDAAIKVMYPECYQDMQDQGVIICTDKKHDEQRLHYDMTVEYLTMGLHQYVSRGLISPLQVSMITPFNKNGRKLKIMRNSHLMSSTEIQTIIQEKNQAKHEEILHIKQGETIIFLVNLAHAGVKLDDDVGTDKNYAMHIQSESKWMGPEKFQHMFHYKK